MTANDPRKYKVMRGNLQLGCVSFKESHLGSGWMFFPYTSAIRPSKKLWPTPDAALNGRVGQYQLEAQQ